jgi:protocatechuate 3,4-dioxygenase beta subunit
MLRSFLAFTLLSASVLQAQERSHMAPAEAPWQLRIAARDEPGSALRITGTVLDDKGVAIRGASLYVYQTDTRGYYTPEDARANQNARIHGYLRTDRRGQFEIATVRPGTYPATKIPQHVHVVVNAPGFAERIYEIIFDDDANVDAQVRSRAAQPNSMYSICKPTKEGELQHCVEKVVLVRSAS